MGNPGAGRGASLGMDGHVPALMCGKNDRAKRRRVGLNGNLARLSIARGCKREPAERQFAGSQSTERPGDGQLREDLVPHITAAMQSRCGYFPIFRSDVGIFSAALALPERLHFLGAVSEAEAGHG